METVKEKKRKYQKIYRKKNKEKIQKNNKEYREKNKEKIKQNDRNYYIKNKEKIKQNNKEYNLKNKDKIQKYQKKYKLKYKDKIQKYHRKRSLKKKINIIKLTNKKICKNCGNDDPFVLEWHHLDPKIKKFTLNDIVQSTKNKYSKKEILEESQKCIILCSNCHNKKHGFNPTSLSKKHINQKRAKYINDYKIKNYCIICNESNTNTLLYHHRNPFDKLFALNKGYEYKMEKILEEIKKCDILCFNCHFYIHSILGRKYEYDNYLYNKTINIIRSTSNLYLNFLK